MNFHEKSAWACLISIVAVFLPYFWLVFPNPLAFPGLLIAGVVCQIVLLVAFHIVNAVATQSIRERGNAPAPDELDRLIELRAAKVFGAVLATVVAVWSLCAMIGAPAAGVSQLRSVASTGADPTPEQFVVPMRQALVAVHLLFAGFIGANLAYYGLIVASYRRLGRG